jgi:hypothetical protein
MNKLVILTDTGTFKAYRLEQDQNSSSPRLAPVQAFEMVTGDDRISRQLSDQQGQHNEGPGAFPGAKNGETGERHNIWLENEKRSVREIARTMGELLADDAVESCYFAASNEINKEIIDHLPPAARMKIEKNLHCNLVNEPREELLNRFQQ